MSRKKTDASQTKTPEPAADPVKFITITVPIAVSRVPPDAQARHRFIASHVEVRFEGPHRFLRHTLRAMMDAIDASPNVRLANGKRPNGGPDTIKWLLEQIAAQAPAAAE